MKALQIAITALTMLPAAAAYAGDDCHVPREAWQPREAAMQAAAGLGWLVDKIEADDGCWEIKGRDAQGRHIKVKLDPATLQVVKFRHRDNQRSREREHGNAATPAPSAPSANPLFRNGTPPVVRVN